MRYTLVADGTSDAVLMSILTWSIQRFYAAAIEEQWADHSRIPRQSTQQERIQATIALYPCDLLFVHRDAENDSYDVRVDEIESLVSGLAVRHVPVVPVRMTEAWLLGDVGAIRSAAGNPNGSIALNLPAIARFEDIPDPKKTLHHALVVASGLNASRRRRLRPEQMIHRIPAYTRDFSHLLVLPAFQSLQDRVRMAVSALDSVRAKRQ